MGSCGSCKITQVPKEAETSTNKLEPAREKLTQKEDKRSDFLVRSWDGETVQGEKKKKKKRKGGDGRSLLVVNLTDWEMELFSSIQFFQWCWTIG